MFSWLFGNYYRHYILLLYACFSVGPLVDVRHCTIKSKAILCSVHNWMRKAPLYWIVACNFTCSQISIKCIQNMLNNKNRSKCNLNAITLKINLWNNDQKGSKELPEQYKCYYQICMSIKVNIHRVVKNFKLLHHNYLI